MLLIDHIEVDLLPRERFDQVSRRHLLDIVSLDGDKVLNHFLDGHPDHLIYLFFTFIHACLVSLILQFFCTVKAIHLHAMLYLLSQEVFV